MFHKFPRSSTLPSEKDNQFDDVSWDKSTYVLIVLIILIPTIFSLIICTVAFFIYRRNQRHAANQPTNYAIRDNEVSPPFTTIIYNPRHSPYVFEETPPPYETLSEKKEYINKSIGNINEQGHSSALANRNQETITTTTTFNDNNFQQ